MPSSGSHEEFVQLCALSTSGELTDEEWRRLEEHLLDCPSCREAKRQYESIVADALPVLAEVSRSGQGIENDPSHWSVEHAEASLMSALDAKPTASAGPPAGLSKKPASTHLRSYLLAAIVLLCGGAVLHFALNYWRHQSPRHVRNQTAKVVPVRTPATPDKTEQLQHTIAQNETEIARLRVALQDRSTKMDRLNAEESRLQQELAARTDTLTAMKQRTADPEGQLASAHTESAGLQAKLDDAEKQQSENASQIAALQNKIAVLNVELREGDQEVSRDEVLLAHDRDIRNLMGARNLYIAEIYDSAKNGKNKKPFGRVFYTKDKSLIFYAYDLDQQPGVENTSTFQAWGSTGTSDHDINLGLFYRDNSDNKRWILKCDDPQTIASLNAVFVTIEPKGGSTKPTGKMLLFSYLRVNPNHP
ncbi:MAG: hypothetical protein WA634_06495 [Silvibacterium sp.]